MRPRHLAFACITCLVLTASGDHVARGQDCFYGYGGGWWNQPLFGCSGSMYGSNYVPVPPYFSIHPPVYYSSRIIYRPMGDSPFAYPPQRAGENASPLYANDLPTSQPLAIPNPYLSAKTSQASDKLTVTQSQRPQVIYNPYVDQATGQAKTQLARFGSDRRTSP